MSKPIIAIDADDTLFDENNAVRLFHNKRYGTKHTAEDYDVQSEFENFWERVWGTDQAEAFRRYEEFIKWKIKHNLPPLPGALETLKKLKQQYKLVVVTMRDERGIAMTHGALTKHYPEIFSDVHFAQLWGGDDKATKAGICIEIGAEYLIDDGFRHCELAAEAGVNALLFGDYGWNQHQEPRPRITRVSDWLAVQEYFDGRS